MNFAGWRRNGRCSSEDVGGEVRFAMLQLSRGHHHSPHVVAWSPDQATPPDRRSPQRMSARKRRPSVNAVARSGDRATTGAWPGTWIPLLILQREDLAAVGRDQGVELP